MAFRAGGWILRKSGSFSREAVSAARRQHASRLLAAGSAACGRERTGFSFPPTRFITSDAFLNRLTRGKAPETDDVLHHHPASVLPDSGEHLSLLVKSPDQPENPKVLRVAIIGAPNAGKSTLSNQLLGRKVFAVSKKVHTTRSRALGVLTEDDTQIILLDTPGLTPKSKVKRHQLEKSLLVDPWNSVKEADIMVVMVDVADKWTCNKLDFEVLKCLAQNPDTPAVLVLNKTDLLKNKSKLLEVTAELTCGLLNGRRTQVRPLIKAPRAEKRPAGGDAPGLPESAPDESNAEPGGGAEAKEQLRALRKQQGWPHFKDIFMLSSVDQEDVETLKRYLVVAAKPGDWQYHSEVLTDQAPEDVCINIVREKLLEYLPQEVPYTMTQFIELWQDGDNGDLDISVKVYAKKDSHMKMVIGAAGHMIARIAREAGEDLSRVFLRTVKLRLSVKLRN